MADRTPELEMTFLTRALEEEEGPLRQSRAGREERAGREGGEGGVGAGGERGNDRKQRYGKGKDRVRGKDKGRDDVADRVMSRVAEECGLTATLRDTDNGHNGFSNTSNDLNILRNRVVLAKT